MAYVDFTDLTRRTAPDKILSYKAFNIAKNPKYDGCLRKLTSMVYKFFVEELHKPIIRKFEKRKVRSPFIDNIWGADLADMQLISKFNKGIRFLLCVIDIYNKYAWVFPLKDEKGITITNAFQKRKKAANFTIDK